jgi:hypothetical protein
VSNEALNRICVSVPGDISVKFNFVSNIMNNALNK